MDMRLTALALGSAACVGLALVLTQLGLRHLSPLRGACVSVPTTALILLALAPAALDTSGFQTGSAILFVLAGCLFPAAVTLLTFEANRRIGPIIAGALGNLTPLFAVLIAFVLLDEIPRWGQLAGMGVIFAGVLLLLGGPQVLSYQAFGWAIALPLAAALIRGLVQPVVKLGLEAWPSPFAATLIGYLVSALVVLTVGTIKEGRALATFDRRGWMWFAAVGVCNGLAVLTMYAALARGPIAVVAPLVACYPLATLAFGRLLLGSGGLTRRTGLGVAITVAGVALLLRA